LTASLGRTDVEDELHARKPEELGTDTSAWCCSTTTQVNTSISQRQCSSHPVAKALHNIYPYLFTEEEISTALQKTKPERAPGYDNIHVEFLKNLGPKARIWLSKFFSRITATYFIPKIWRKAKVIAVEKSGKDLSSAANYRPISLLSVRYKLLEHLALQRISHTVEGLLSPDQAGFRKGRSTCEQVAALTTFIENGFQQNLKTGAVFLDLTGLLSKSMPYWFTRLVGLLLRDRSFRVHMGNDTSSWKPQCNGPPQGSVLAPILFILYSNDLPITRGHKFICADDICLDIQSQFFSEPECSLSSDIAHLHNSSATRELSVYLYGQRLRHDCHPTYLGVTLDRMLSYREHLTKTAGKLKN